MLTAIIKSEIQEKGPIPFARFMELSLYHPEQGYYSSPRPKIGPQGDYYTSPHVHPIFANLLAKQITQMATALPARGTIMIVEFGAGNGLLCQQILGSLAQQDPPLFARLHYVIIETSRAFRDIQKKRLLPSYAQIVDWADQMPKFSVGVVLSNELLDAFPVHRLRIENGVLHEIYVDIAATAGEASFCERLGSPSSPELIASCARVDLPMDRTFEFEINLRALDWIRRVGDALQSGFVLTIDYGYPAEQLYDPSRKKGTFLCYHQHTVNDDPYRHIGEQDMTSHVDFTALARAGEESGLSLLGFTDQSRFLIGLGITETMQMEADQMEQSDTARKNFIAMKQLMAPERMGRTFKVMIQGKGVTPPIALDGLTFKDPYFFPLAPLGRGFG